MVLPVRWFFWLVSGDVVAVSVSRFPTWLDNLVHAHTVVLRRGYSLVAVHLRARELPRCALPIHAPRCAPLQQAALVAHTRYAYHPSLPVRTLVGLCMQRLLRLPASFTSLAANAGRGVVRRCMATYHP